MIFIFLTGTSQGSNKKTAPKACEFIDSLKKMCQSKKPEVGIYLKIYNILNFCSMYVIKLYPWTRKSSAVILTVFPVIWYFLHVHPYLMTTCGGW